MATSNVTQNTRSLNDIYKNKYQADPDTIDSQLYGDLAGLAGQNPRGWRAIWGGFFKGMESGSKSKAAEKFSRNMDWLESVQKSSLNRNIQLEEQAFQMEQVKPFAAAALEASYSGGDYANTNQAMGNIFQQLQLKMPSLNNYRYAGYVPNSGIINIVDEKGNPSAVNVATYAGNEVANRVTDNYLKNQQLDISREHNDISRMNANTSRMNADAYAKSLSGSATNMENPYAGIPLASLKGKGVNAIVTRAQTQMGLSEEAPQIFKQLNEAKEIIASHPNLGRSWTNLIGSSPYTRDALSKTDREAYEIVEKISNRVAEAYIRAKGNAISESEREKIQKGLFDVTQAKGSKEYNIDSVENELKIGYLRGKFAADQLSKGFAPTPQGFELYIEQNPNILQEVDQKYNLGSSQNDKVTILTPMGTKIKIDKAGLSKALKSGAKQIDG
jgi:hypothetical protein